jgi:hypothetical protein
MFSYSQKIHQQSSVIYGVFNKEELFYAVELKGFEILQAKGISNTDVPEEDMAIIRGWNKNIKKTKELRT